MRPKTHTSDTQCTWTKYQTWPEGERWEIIDGVAYNMSPAPSTRHQTVVIRISSRLELKLSHTLVLKAAINVLQAEFEAS